MKTICGADCTVCERKTACNGCEATGGRPFGGKCLAAEYIKVGGKAAFDEFKQQLLSEINALGIAGMPEIKELYCLCGSFVNLAYPLADGTTVKFLDDSRIYLGAQAECLFAEDEDADRCFGLVADADFLLVCQYSKGGENPELLLYKKR